MSDDQNDQITVPKTDNNREHKTIIQNKIKTGECILETHRGKSKVWDLFSKIIYANNDEVQLPKDTGYVCCTKCKTILTYSSSCGVSHLNRHKCQLNVNNERIDNFFAKRNKPNIPSSVTIEAVNCCIKLCSLDIRPFEAVDGEGFRQLCQFLINTGARYGKIDAADLMPHPTTVSRNCLKMAESLRSELLAIILPYFNNGRCSATTDMWTDDFKKIGYTAITIHYINDEWQLKSNVLCVKQFEIDKKKTGENINKSLKQFFGDWAKTNGEEWLSKLTWVTDRGSNIIKALEKYTRINCSAHILHNILQETFSLTEQKSTENTDAGIQLQYLKPVDTLISASKSLVRYMKKSGDNNLLSKPLHQHVETRWYSKVIMLQSIRDMYEELIKLYGHNHTRLKYINVDLLTKLIDFLIPFKEASTKIEGEKYSTINLVVLYRCKLVKHLESIKHNTQIDETSKTLKILAARALNAMESKFKLHRNHEIALFLFPPYKSMKMMGESEKNRVIGNVKLELLKIQENQPVRNEVNQVHPEVQAPSTSSYNNMFSEWENDFTQPNAMSSYENELESYTHSTDTFQTNENILDWWKARNNILPTMAKLAIRILAIPATSAASERAFSAAGRVIEERRSCLKAETIDALLFLQDYQKEK